MLPIKTLVFYFHGYGSSSRSDKVVRLATNQHVKSFAFDIDVDPSISIPILEKKIDDVLISHYSDDINVVFVGTSLGAWFACKLAYKYNVKAIAINPCINPRESLKKYGVDQYILDNYTETIFDYELTKIEFHVSRDDEVLDFSQYERQLSMCDTTWYTGVPHRFSGPEFDNIAKSL